MFFVVHFRDAAINQVVPHKWIMNISEHLEKFINNGLNRNQKYTVYWTNAAGSIDENGVPKSDFVPNFNVSRNTHFPNEGLYLCNLLRFQGKI